MKKILIVVGIAILLLLITQKSKIKKMGENIFNAVETEFQKIKTSFYLSAQQISILSKAVVALLNSGCPKSSLPFVIAQLAFETGHFKSSEALIDNNLSGIKYVGNVPNKFGQNQRDNNVTQGQYLNPNSQEVGGYYAHYPSVNEWAKNYLFILNNAGTAKPLEQTTASGYAHALKVNKYYEASEIDYAKGIDSLSKMYAPFISAINKFF